METSYGLAVLALMFILLIIAMKWRRKIIQDTLNEFSEKPYSYTLVIHGENTDAIADKIIVNAGTVLKNFAKEDFKPELFTVQVKDGNEKANRKVTKAYPCDIDGNETESDSQENDAASHFALELESNTESNFEHPFVENVNDSARIKDKTGIQCKNKEIYEYSINHKKLPEAVTLCNDWWWADNA